MAKIDIYDQLLNETLQTLDEKGSEVEAEERNRKKDKRKNKKAKETKANSPSEKKESSADADVFGLSNLNLGPMAEYPDYEIRDEEVLPKKTDQSPGRVKKGSRKFGEPVSEEYVEELKNKKGAPEDGYKATVIFHTKTVSESGELIEESTDLPEEQKSEKKSPEKKELLLVRLDTGETYPLEGRLTIGRDDDNDICIPEPEGHYVSGFHATIEVDERGRIKLMDKDGIERSTNGTKVNGTKIATKYVRPGDTICFANVDFVIPKQ